MTNQVRYLLISWTSDWGFLVEETKDQMNIYVHRVPWDENISDAEAINIAANKLRESLINESILVMVYMHEDIGKYYIARIRDKQPKEYIDNDDKLRQEIEKISGDIHLFMSHVNRVVYKLWPEWWGLSMAMLKTPIEVDKYTDAQDTN